MTSLIDMVNFDMKSKPKIQDLGYGTKPKKGLVLRGDLKFGNGARYSGALKSYFKQIPHGYGIYFFPEHGQMKKIDGACQSDLVRNGNFDQNSAFWTRYNNAYLDITSNKQLKVSNRVNDGVGAYQDLFIDKNCFKEKQRYLVTGKFRLESALNGTQYNCDRTQSHSELQCGFMLIYARSDLGNDEYITIAETVAVHENFDDGFHLMAGIMTVTAKQAAHTRSYVRMYGPHEAMNVY